MRLIVVQYADCNAVGMNWFAGSRRYRRRLLRETDEIYLENEIVYLNRKRESDVKDSVGAKCCAARVCVVCIHGG